MKIWQVEIQTETKGHFSALALAGNKPAPMNLTHRTFGTKEKAEEYLRQCQQAYSFLQGAAGLGRLQHMNFVLKEYEVEE